MICIFMFLCSMLICYNDLGVTGQFSNFYNSKLWNLHIASPWVCGQGFPRPFWLKLAENRLRVGF